VLFTASIVMRSCMIDRTGFTRTESAHQNETEHHPRLGRYASLDSATFKASVRTRKEEAMNMKKEVSEEDILRVFAEEMEARGKNRKLVILDVNDLMVEKINSVNGININLEQLCKLADRCLSNEWLEHTVMGVGKYGRLSLTTTGLGVVRSRQRKEEALAKRSSWEKALDYTEDHKGLFLALAAAIAILGLLLYWFAG